MIDAVDWSGDAWESNVLQQPASVQFFQYDDERFLQQPSSRRYDIILYNFAINAAKATKVAQNYLTSEGILLAPVNDKADYWYKQTYYKLNAQGQVLYKSNPDVGAWSVQFQPDVTADSCTGIWCGSFNGFKQ